VLVGTAGLAILVGSRRYASYYGRTRD
jgi:hypothetical protein